MDFTKHYLNLTLEAINNLILNRNSMITAKRIRIYHKIPSSDKSKINFIWRSLEYIEEKGLIERYSIKTPKIYKLPPELLKIENLVGDGS